MNQEVIDFLNARENASEAVAITTFEVYFGSRPATVRVRDRGEGTGSMRYSVEAEWSEVDEQTPFDTAHTYGNPASTLREALFNAHWQNFRQRD